MKFIYLLILFNFSSDCYSQTSSSSLNTFTLKGEVAGRSNGRIILSYQDSTNVWIYDTTQLENGKFSFQGFINQPTLGILGDPKYVNGREVNSVPLFLEPKKLTVKLTEGDYENASLKGSKTQDEYNVFLKEKNEVEVKWDSVNYKFDQLSTIYNSNQTDSIEKMVVSEKMDEMRMKMKQKDQEIEDIRYRYIAQFPDSYITAYFLAFLQDRPSIEFYEKAYGKFSDKVKKSRYGKSIRKNIERRLLVDLGAISPEFSAFNPEEKKITLSKMKGKIVLLDFWASWCIPCREGIPDLKKYYELYHSKGFEVVTISVDRNKSDWKEAILEDKITHFNNVRTNDEIAKGYENVFLPIPSQILINSEGKIIWKDTFNKETNSKSLNSVLLEIFDK